MAYNLSHIGNFYWQLGNHSWYSLAINSSTKNRGKRYYRNGWIDASATWIIIKLTSLSNFHYAMRNSLAVNAHCLGISDIKCLACGLPLLCDEWWLHYTSPNYWFRPFIVNQVAIQRAHTCLRTIIIQDLKHNTNSTQFSRSGFEFQ